MKSGAKPTKKKKKKSAANNCHITSHNLNKELYDAAKAGQEGSVVTLLNQNADINFIFEDEKGNHRSVLMIACEQGHLKTVKALVTFDPRIVNQVNKDNSSALIIAVASRQTEICQFLLNKGADVKQKNNHGWTAFLITCSHENIEIAGVLLAHDASLIEDFTKEKKFPLLFSSYFNKRKMVEWLLKQGVDAKSKDYNGWTAFMAACQSGHLGIAKILFKHDPSLIDMLNNDEGTALLMATQHGQLKMVKWLLKQGANVKNVNNEGCNALHIACFYKHPEVASVILEHYPGLINLKDKRGNMALHYACETNDEDCVKILLANGINLDFVRQNIGPKLDLSTRLLLIAAVDLSDFCKEVIEAYKARLPFSQQLSFTNSNFAKVQLFKLLYPRLDIIRPCFGHPDKKVFIGSLVQCLFEEKGPISSTTVDAAFNMTENKVVDDMPLGKSSMLTELVQAVIEVYKANLPFTKQLSLTDEQPNHANEQLYKLLYPRLAYIKDCFSNPRQSKEIATKLGKCLIAEEEDIVSKRIDVTLLENNKTFLLGRIVAQVINDFPIELMKQITLFRKCSEKATDANQVYDFDMDQTMNTCPKLFCLGFALERTQRAPPSDQKEQQALCKEFGNLRI